MGGKSNSKSRELEDDFRGVSQLKQGIAIDKNERIGINREKFSSRVASPPNSHNELPFSVSLSSALDLMINVILSMLRSPTLKLNGVLLEIARGSISSSLF